MQLGIYQHYKGQHYLVLGVARHSETNEELVVYVPLYLHPNGGKALQARPRAMWDEIVDNKDGVAVHRFRYVGEDRPAPDQDKPQPDNG